MGHNSVVSGHSKSIGIPRVDGLSMGPPDLKCHIRTRDNGIMNKMTFFQS